MIKKFKAIIPLLYIFSSTAYGYDELLKKSNSTESGRKLIYLKANVGAMLLNDSEDSASKLKIRSKPVPYFAVGVGTYFMDNTRVDLTFEHVNNTTLKRSGNKSFNDSLGTSIGQIFLDNIDSQAENAFSTNNLIALGFAPAGINNTKQILKNALISFRNTSSAKSLSDIIFEAAVDHATKNGANARLAQNVGNLILLRLGGLSSNSAYQDLHSLMNQDFESISMSTSVNHKSTINAFMVNGSLDLFEFNRVKFFMGAGIGGVQLKEKISITSTLNFTGRRSIILSESVTTKKANNFAYSLTAGTSMKVTDSVTMELAYAWKDFGKTKSVTIKGIEVGKTPYRSHTLSVGVRVDI